MRFGGSSAGLDFGTCQLSVLEHVSSELSSFAVWSFWSIDDTAQFRIENSMSGFGLGFRVQDLGCSFMSW